MRNPSKFTFEFHIPTTRYDLRINLWLIVALLAMEYLLISLGLWQLAREDEKQRLLNQMNATIKLPPLTITGLENNIPDYRPVIVSGNILPPVVYLANEAHQGQDGYHIFNLLQLESSKLVWVNRGWVKALPDRRFLPTVETPPIFWTVQGIAYYSKGDPLLFDHALSEVKENQWLIQGLDFKLLNSVLQPRNSDVLPFIIRLDSEESHGFERNWQWVSMLPEKHLAYAIQWFGLASALFIISSIISIKKRAT